MQLTLAPKNKNKLSLVSQVLLHIYPSGGTLLQYSVAFATLFAYER
jgi:hypothetical protein